jgi:putative CocE/NonD family hydrolase
LSYISAPLDHDLVITGPVSAKLWASSSGTDSDFIVKLIDVFPETGQKSALNSDAFSNSLNGYELPVAMEVRRGRFLKSFEHPAPLVANKPVEWEVPLRDRDHVFLKGHLMMVQIQSTWFPLIDRNPQRFVKRINDAKAGDFTKATQRVWSTPTMSSRIELPTVP